MAKSRYVEQKNQINRALRAVRRAYRTADTTGERLERTVDRLISRKTAVYADQLQPLIALYREYAAKVNGLESSLAALVNIAAY